MAHDRNLPNLTGRTTAGGIHVRTDVHDPASFTRPVPWAEATPTQIINAIRAHKAWIER